MTNERVGTTHEMPPEPAESQHALGKRHILIAEGLFEHTKSRTSDALCQDQAMSVRALLKQ